MTITFFYILLAICFSFFIGYYQYFYKKKRYKGILILFSLKVLSLFLLLLLFINPKFNTSKNIDIKPTLSVLVDNSKSISYFKAAETVKNNINKLTLNKDLKEKFNIEIYAFGEDINNKDSLDFSNENTNIYKSINRVNSLNKNKLSPIILISDGNQTIGTDYQFLKSNQKIYPVLVGDTTKYSDLRISQLNINKYNFLGNEFPVEIILNYEGLNTVNTQLSIQKNNKIVYKKNLSFSKDNNSKTIQTNLTSTKEGIQYYTAVLTPLNSEKNTINNKKTFSIETINERTNILILSSILHPDLGALKKAISIKKQNNVNIKLISENDYNLIDYQLIILYQPNNQFTNILNKIKEERLNYFLIAGTKTNWNFLNSKSLGFTKSAINQVENYTPIFNSSYITFLQNDIGFNSFPPLEDKFGKIDFQKEHQVLLYQSINGIRTENPLLASFSENNQKTGALFGENIWKWRATTFLNTNSFSDFDEFVGNIIQYLASTKKRNRLEVDIEPIYAANSTINVNAFFTDKNYKFDSRANLEITITNKDTNAISKFPFSLKNNNYQVNIENLLSGDYTYQVSVLEQNMTRNGTFKITDYQIEEQFTNANSSKMKQLAKQTEGKFYYVSKLDDLINQLVNDNTYFTKQKQVKKLQQLIDWKWILFIIILLLTTEWFIRKYLGKI